MCENEMCESEGCECNPNGNGCECSIEDPCECCDQ